MGIDEKLGNMSRRCVGRSLELFGKITHNTTMQLAGYTTWSSACEEADREKAKDAIKAMEAVAAFGLAGRPVLEPMIKPASAMPNAADDTAATRPSGWATGTATATRT
ncbi:hypothetical protein ACFQY4_18890 [Catellatospora bangladeshensis]|uniref:Uncharacterized protein n=1 Tax=Catellatospora bangladeshensis TaxID=310355 RepID=A0A8J3NKW7_9ACTN|nr:hypothetical protein [Catellatospora bangladeshensis]GIF81935.1 hypothetical protein Cba03nite_32840 [Catellatospora bangladeshensis]